MKKVSVMLISMFILIGLAGCSFGAYTYVNKDHKFSLDFPKTWGIVTAEVPKPFEIKDEKGKVVLSGTEINILPDNKTPRFFKVLVFKKSDAGNPALVDLPALKLGEIGEEIFVSQAAGDYSGAPEQEDPIYAEMAAEVISIRKSFKSF